MGRLKGTLTEKNLLKSFAGESQARNRYTFFASVAKKEGYEQIAGIFHETADNEKEHAEVFFKHLEGGDVEIIAAYPAGKIGNTDDIVGFFLLPHALIQAQRGEDVVVDEKFVVLFDEIDKPLL